MIHLVAASIALIDLYTRFLPSSRDREAAQWRKAFTRSEHDRSRLQIRVAALERDVRILEKERLLSLTGDAPGDRSNFYDMEGMRQARAALEGAMGALQRIFPRNRLSRAFEKDLRAVERTIDDLARRYPTP